MTPDKLGVLFTLARLEVSWSLWDKPSECSLHTICVQQFPEVSIHQCKHESCGDYSSGPRHTVAITMKDVSTGQRRKTQNR